MSIRVNPENAKQLFDEGVRKVQLKSLVNNYYHKMKKKKDTSVTELDYELDSKAAWFPKDKIDQLFKDNGNDQTNNSEYGLRIYFGVHKKGILADPKGTDIPPGYDNQQTVILVVTKNEGGKSDHDQLGEGSFVQIAGYTGMAMDNGKLCPPEVCDGSEIGLP